MPVDPNAPLIEGVCQDTMHMGHRMAERLTNKTASVSSAFTGEKLSDSFQLLARTTGAPFSIYKKSKNGKTQIKFSPMTAGKWRLLVHRIGPKIRESQGVLPEDVKAKFAELYERFDAILAFAGTCEPEDAEELARETRSWTKLFLDLGLEMAPYVHDFQVHLPMSVKLFGGQDKLNGQLVEKKNGGIKKTHLQKTNRKNPQMTLTTQLRIEHHELEKEAKELEAEKGRKSRATSHCAAVGEGNRQREKEARQREEEERRQFTEERTPYAELSLPQLKELIKTKSGKSTLKRTREGLLAILQNLDNGGNCESRGK